MKPVDRILRLAREIDAPKEIGPGALPCWVTPPQTMDGRRRVTVSLGKQTWAYRVTYEEFIGPIPEGLVPDHLCRRPLCVNPWHIDPVPNVVNVMRGVGPTAVNAAKTKCRNGHPLEGDNLRIETNGRRRCLACTRARWRSKSKNPAIANLPPDEIHSGDIRLSRTGRKVPK